MYIVIETFGGVEYAIICTDKKGDNKVFDTEKKAAAYAAKNCQDGRILKV